MIQTLIFVHKGNLENVMDHNSSNKLLKNNVYIIRKNILQTIINTSENKYNFTKIIIGINKNVLNMSINWIKPN